MGRLERLGDIQVLHLLGKGGMGAVYAGEHITTGAPVAVKVLRTDRAPSERAIHDFEAEVRSTAMLSHPGIVQVHDYGRVGAGQPLPEGAPYLVMERVDGGSLLGLAHDRQLSWPTISSMASGMLAALAHAHAAGVLHRDVKLSNVLLDGDRPLLCDFGIAFALHEPQADARRVGTPSYVAPEQLVGDWRSLRPPTDLYALGILLWRLITRRLPFRRAELPHAHLRGRFPPFEPQTAVPVGTHAWLRRMTARDPRDRFATASDASSTLEALGEPVDRAAHVDPADRCERAALRFPSRAPVAQPARNVGTIGLFGLRPVPLFGRDDEKALLWRTLRRVARHGRPAFIELTGAPGSGKSRLAEWLGQEAVERGLAQVLHVTHAKHAGADNGMRALWHRVFRTPGLEPEARTELLAEQGAPEDLGPTLEPELVDIDTCRGVWTETITRLAEQRPVIFRIGDAPWGTDAIDVARRLLAGVDAPVLVLATSRSNAPRLAALDALTGTRIELEPLPPLAHTALVQSMLPLAPKTAQAVAARTQGNPQFAIQLVGDWVARGLLVPAAGGLQPKPGASLTLPTSLQAVWSDRLDLLIAACGPAAWRSLEWAAVLGTDVEATELEALGPIDHQLIDHAVRGGLLRPRVGGWRFADEMLRETVTHRARVEGRLASHHLAAAAMLDRHSPAGLGRRGSHLVHGGATGEGVSLFLAGLQQAIDAVDLLRAGRLQDLASEAIIQLPPAAPQHMVHAMLRAVLAGYRESRDVALAAIGNVRQDADLSSAALAWLANQEGHFLRQEGRGQETEDALVRVRGHAEKAGDDGLRANVSLEMGRLCHWMGRNEEAEAEYRNALALGRTRRDALLQARALLGLQSMADAQGRPQEALALLDEARVRFSSVHSAVGHFVCLNNAASLREGMGQYEAAQLLLERAIAWARRRGDPPPRMPMINLASVLDRLGKHEQALEWLEESVLGKPPWMVRVAAGVTRARVHAGLGDSEAVIAAVDALEQVVGRLGSPQAAEALAEVGRLCEHTPTRMRVEALVISLRGGKEAPGAATVPGSTHSGRM